MKILPFHWHWKIFEMNSVVKVFLCLANVIFIKNIDSKASSYCPEEWCICDTYMDLNRANCSAQNLLNADIGMSKHVEILDLSNNLLTVLDNNCFSVSRMTQFHWIDEPYAIQRIHLGSQIFTNTQLVEQFHPYDWHRHIFEIEKIGASNIIE